MASTGNLPTTGVVLAALDEFSGTMKAYVEGLAKVGGAEDQVGNTTSRTATKTRELGEQHKLGAEKMARYAIGASILTGQLQQMGIGADKAMLPLTILFTTLTEGFNPTGMIVLGVGALTSAVLNLAMAHKQAEQSILASGNALATLRAATGVQTQAERELLELTRTLTRHELVKAQASITAANAEYAHAAAMDAVAQATLNNGPVAADAYDDYMAQATVHMLNKGAAEQHAAAIGKLTLLQAQLKQQMEALNLALTGGTKGHEIAKANADAVWQMQADVAKQDDTFKTSLANSNKHFGDKALAYLKAQASASIHTFATVTQAGIASAEARTDAERRAAQETQALQEQQTRYYLEAAATISQALGAAAMGQVGAWKAAAYAVLDVVKTMVEKAIGITAILNPANLLKLALVEAAFAAAKTAIAGSGNATAPTTTAAAPSYGGFTATGSGYEGGYTSAQRAGAGAPSGGSAPAPVMIHIEQHITGDVSPQTRRQLQADTEDVLYRVGPEAARRARAIGRAA